MQNESEEYRSASAREPASGLPSSCGLAEDLSAGDLGDAAGGPVEFSEPLPGANSGEGALSSSPNRGLAMGVLLLAIGLAEARLYAPFAKALPAAEVCILEKN